MMEVVQVLFHSSDHAFIFVNAFKRFAVGPSLMVKSLDRSHEPGAQEKEMYINLY